VAAPAWTESVCNWHNGLFARPAGWVERVNAMVAAEELERPRPCIRGSRPFGGDAWARRTLPNRAELFQEWPAIAACNSKPIGTSNGRIKSICSLQETSMIHWARSRFAQRNRGNF
jgi:hypothetical protein